MAQIKIKINENESYSINFDKEEISAEEFIGFLERLKDIEKVLLKSAVISDFKVKKTRKNKFSKSNPRITWTGDRNRVLEALKIKYNGTDAERQALAQKNGISYIELSKILIYQMHKHGVKPQEVGLASFPKGRGTLNKVIKKPKKAEKEDKREKPIKAKRGRPKKESPIKKNGNGNLEAYNDRN